MAASSSCSSGGAAMEKLGNLMHQQATTFNGAQGSLRTPPPLYLNSMNAIKRSANIHGGPQALSVSQVVPESAQLSRVASIAVAATAWAGLSMCPAEALAMAFERDHGESNVSTSMLQLSGDADLSAGNSDTDGEGSFSDGNIATLGLNNAGMEASVAVGNVPSVQPPNEGLNSPWLPKINGLLQRKDGRSSSRASTRCPKWTQSELEMVLPDLQGQPKPFPRMQGRPYPFWPAKASANDNGGDGGNAESQVKDLESLSAIRSASSPSSNTHSPQQSNLPIEKASSCFTL